MVLDEHAVSGRPEPGEAPSYYHRYIDRIGNVDIVSELHTQLDATLAFLRDVSEERSLHRYAPDKWSVREVLSHINDTERVFVFRALWFARGFDSALPSFDEKTCTNAALADRVSWRRHVEEFHAVRLATLSFFQSLSQEAWMRSGLASGKAFTVRALAYIVAGHVAHHAALLDERYSLARSSDVSSPGCLSRERHRPDDST